MGGGAHHCGAVPKPRAASVVEVVRALRSARETLPPKKREFRREQKPAGAYCTGLPFPRLARQGWASAGSQQRRWHSRSNALRGNVRGGRPQGNEGHAAVRGYPLPVANHVRRKAPLVLGNVSPFAGRCRNGGLGRRARGAGTPGRRGGSSMTQGVFGTFSRRGARETRVLLSRFPGPRRPIERWETVVARCCAGGRDRGVARPRGAIFGRLRPARGRTKRHTRRERKNPLPGAREGHAARVVLAGRVVLQKSVGDVGSREAVAGASLNRRGLQGWPGISARAEPGVSKGTTGDRG
jgi:hypothetical protein